MSETPETIDNPAAPVEESQAAQPVEGDGGELVTTPEAGDDTDLTAEDANAVPSADDPDDMEGTAEATDDGLEHDPAEPEVEPEATA